MTEGSGRTRRLDDDDDRTPVETPLPARYAKCALHDDIVGGLKQDVAKLDAKLDKLGGEFTELRGHVLEAIATVKTHDERIFSTAKATSGTGGKVTTLVSLVGVIVAIGLAIVGLLK